MSELAPGTHRLRVSREGFRTFEKAIVLAPQQVIAETVTLEQSVEPVSPLPATEKTRPLHDGVYGGMQLGMALMPQGAGTSFDQRCDFVGASSCTTQRPQGALAGGYFGYSLDPIGFELFGAMIADVAHPVVHFDGATASAVNPLVAQPARDEAFVIFRAGVATAGRVRATLDFGKNFQASAAIGVGLSWKTLWAKRTATATDGTGAKNEFVPDPVSYLSPGLSLDLSARWRFGHATSVALGAWCWAETASSNARTKGEAGRFFASDSSGVLPRPIATPSYDLANGPQVYVGPYLGLQFGP